MVIQFEAEALDLIRNPTKPDFVRLKADPKHQAIQHPARAGAYALGINVKRPPLDNKKVRQALNYAIDRKRFRRQHSARRRHATLAAVGRGLPHV